MTFRAWLLLGLSLLAGLTQSLARAADEPQAPTYVVLVGIDRFQDPQIKSREHAEADAQALYDVLTSPDYLGVPAGNVKLLLGSADKTRPSTQATRENLLGALQWLEKTPAKNSLVIFAYFGQGAPMGERTCYFTVDSTFKDRTKNALASGDLLQAFEKLQNQRLVAFLDLSLFDIDLGKEPMPDPNLQGFYKDLFSTEDGEKTLPNSRVIFVANKDLKRSIDLEKHGIFAQVLLDGLKGKADIDGYEADGNITINEIAKYIGKQLPILAREVGKTDEQKGQSAVVLFEGPSSDFVVDHNPATFPESQKRLESFDKIAQQDVSLTKDLLEEGRDLLGRMPKLESRQSLRKAYQKLADRKVDVATFQTERRSILDETIISEREASNYAIMVLRAVKLVRQSYVKDVNSGELVENAVRGMYKNIDEKLPSALDDRLKVAKDQKEVQLIKLLTDARQKLGKREDLSKGKDITLSLHTMLSHLDKHTDYIDPELVERMGIDLGGQFFGIGVQIRKNNIRDQLEVVTPIWNSPAYKAGMKAKDIISTIVREVDSTGKPLEKPETLSTKGMTTEDAVKKILGKEGTKVRLLVERDGAKEPIEFNLIRGKVEVESVMGASRNNDDTWNYVVDPENKICYVRLTGFTRNTYRDLERVMKGLSKVGIKGFVLDLRFNPGGLLDQAVKISDLYIDDGLIVSIRPRNGPETSYVGKSDGSYTTVPMVCLVNGGSASASEIVSACLQDHHRAIIVGTRSYGKGSVQTIHAFDTGGQLKLTTATFWRPSNRNLNRSSTKGRDEDEWGVTPDNGFDIKLNKKEENDLQDHLRDTEIIRGPPTLKTDSGKAEFRDRQLDAALEYLRTQVRLGGQNTAQSK